MCTKMSGVPSPQVRKPKPRSRLNHLTCARSSPLVGVTRTHVSVTPTSGLERAQVKWFNRLRGFGFLTCGEGTPDIFVHMETLRRFGMTELRPGQYVLVRFGPGSKGMMAAEIQPESGATGLASH